MQSARQVSRLAAGRFLVARRDIPDPNFSETVIVLVQHDAKGAMGFIINRQTTMEVSRLLRDFKQARGRSDPVYMGGPVSIAGALGLIRSDKKLADARLVFADVYLVSSKEALEKALTASKDAKSLRMFLGYAGWGAGQLEGEVKMGMWHIFEVDPSVIFDSDPSSVWLRLIEQTELRIASGPAPLVDCGLSAGPS
ncbi:MAG: YqgE/AlgH family protein [Bryobacteraceae bacterium]|nr:YqgE/AlgH family protein [Bryobacteraceae bacterium]